MSRFAALAIAVAFASAPMRGALAEQTATAALSCANPALPAAILDGPATRASKRPLKTIRVNAPEAPLTLAVADDSPTREVGLMCVMRLRPHAGMLFVFGQSDELDFWMKNTLIPLDMIWVDSGGEVRNVAEDVPASKLTTPDDAVARRSGYGLYVIELARGEAAKAGITVGTRLPIVLWR